MLCLHPYANRDAENVFDFPLPLRNRLNIKGPGAVCYARAKRGRQHRQQQPTNKELRRQFFLFRQTRGYVDSPKNKEPMETSSVRHIAQTNALARLELKAQPLFLFQSKAAYDHNFGFSYAGSDYLEIYDLPREDISNAYDFVVSIYPEQGDEFKKRMKFARGDREVEFMTQNQPSYSVAAENPEETDVQMLPFSIENLIRNSRDPRNVGYYTRIRMLCCLATKVSGEFEDDKCTEINKKSKEVVTDLPKTGQISTNNTMAEDGVLPQPTLKNATTLTTSERQSLMPHHPAYKSFTVVETLEHLDAFLKILKSIHRMNGQPDMFFRSTITTKMIIFSIFLASYNTTWMLNIQSLRNSVFDRVSEGPHPVSLRQVLQNKSTPKIVYDAGRESKVLFNEYGITLLGTIDIEILYSVRFGSSEADYTDLNSLILKLPASKLEWQQFAKYKFLYRNGLCKDGEWDEYNKLIAPLDRETAITEVQILAPLFVDLSRGMPRKKQKSVVVLSEILCKNVQGSI